jgi:hypothetical protein
MRDTRDEAISASHDAHRSAANPRPARSVRHSTKRRSWFPPTPSCRMPSHSHAPERVGAAASPTSGIPTRIRSTPLIPPAHPTNAPASLAFAAPHAMFQYGRVWPQSSLIIRLMDSSEPSDRVRDGRPPVVRRCRQSGRRGWSYPPSPPDRSAGSDFAGTNLQARAKAKCHDLRTTDPAKMRACAHGSRGQPLFSEEPSGSASTIHSTRIFVALFAQRRFSEEPSLGLPSPEIAKSNPENPENEARFIGEIDDAADARPGARSGDRRGDDGGAGANRVVRPEDRGGNASASGAGPFARARFGRSKPSCTGERRGRPWGIWWPDQGGEPCR